MKDAHEQKRILERLEDKIADKRRYERALKAAAERLERHPDDEELAAEMHHAVQRIKELQSRIRSLAGEL